jgi:RHS repeat-associated protein
LRNTNGVQYLFGDHLGSTSIIADSTGSLLAEQRYTAYGESRHMFGTLSTDYQYTGQRSQMGEVGLYYYNARWYDPAMGRFTQADTLVPQPGNAQDWDRYAYVRNNPVAYSDPSGHKQECGHGGDTHCGVGAGPLIATQIVQAREGSLDNIWAVTEFALGFVAEPADWAVTSSHCIQGDCDPLMLLGLLPFIPSSLGSHTDDIAGGIGRVIRATTDGGSLRPFTQRNFRKNLQIMTNKQAADIAGMEAHHILPQEFDKLFDSLKIKIHDPKYGVWVDASEHRKFSYEYNEKWRYFLSEKRTPEDISLFAMGLAKEYGWR